MRRVPAPSDSWRPATSELLLVECARRLVDLQAWVVRRHLSVFTASRIKAQVVAPGTYLRRSDAIRYCEESGLEVSDVPRALVLEGTNPSLEAQNASPRSAPLTDGDKSSTAPKDIPRVSPESARASSRPGTRLLRPKEAIARTGLSRSTFYDRQDPKSRYFDKSFPSPVQIGQSARGYREDELDAWIASRPHKER
ncbi:helix-turn-helix transcriptional regulator [Variovorax atrisoli]|uniref:helix-turn-helix transcriptional regulator n=1 Tax=Variovorax atrisoli TaxID=3394203 RepID=UPI0033949CBD